MPITVSIWLTKKTEKQFNGNESERIKNGAVPHVRNRTLIHGCGTSSDMYMLICTCWRGRVFHRSMWKQVIPRPNGRAQYAPVTYNYQVERARECGGSSENRDIIPLLFFSFLFHFSLTVIGKWRHDVICSTLMIWLSWNLSLHQNSHRDEHIFQCINVLIYISKLAALSLKKIVFVDGSKVCSQETRLIIFLWWNRE